MSPVRITTNEELIKKYRNLLEITGKMRRYQKSWEENYGVELKTLKKHWEAKADEYLSDLGGQPEIIIES